MTKKRNIVSEYLPFVVILLFAIGYGIKSLFGDEALLSVLPLFLALVGIYLLLSAADAYRLGAISGDQIHFRRTGSFGFYLLISVRILAGIVGIVGSIIFAGKIWF